MQSHPHDDLEHLPDLSLTDEERAIRMGMDNQDKSKAPHSVKNKSDTAVLNGKHRSLKRYLFPVGCLVLLIMAGWQINSLWSEMAKKEAKMNQLVAQMDQVAGTLSTRDVSASKNTERLNEKIGTLVAAKNRQEKHLADISKKMTNAQSLTAENQKDIANLRWRNKLDADARTKIEKNLTETSNRLESTVKEIQRINASQLSMTADLDGLMEKIKAEIGQTSKTQEKENQQWLQKKLSGYEGSIKSMDSYRLQINRRLLQMENSLRELQKQLQSHQSLKSLS